MENGHVLRRTLPAVDPPQLIEFHSYVVDLERFEPKAGHIELKPRERYFQELAFPRPDDPDFKRQPGHFRAELHERFANPFYALAFVMLTVALIGRAQSTRQNRWEATALAGAISVGARVGGLAANSLVIVSGKWVALLYAIPLGLILLSALMIQFGARARGPSRLRRLITGAGAALAARLPRPRRRRADAAAAGTPADAAGSVT
jgi:lipopolysaccharide export system permease protein